MDGGNNFIDWIVDLWNRAPGLVTALAPSAVVGWAVLYARKLQDREPENDDTTEKTVEMLEKIESAVSRAATHVARIENIQSRIEGIQQRMFEEVIRQGARKE